MEASPISQLTHRMEADGVTVAADQSEQSPPPTVAGSRKEEEEKDMKKNNLPSPATGTTPSPPQNPSSSTMPCVTAEKDASNNKDVKDTVSQNGPDDDESDIDVFQATIRCPDGTNIELTSSAACGVTNSSSKSVAVLGRGKHGIPPPSSFFHVVDPLACVFRIVKKNTNEEKKPTSYGLELTVIGSQPWCVTTHSSATTNDDTPTITPPTTTNTGAKRSNQVIVSSPLMQNDFGQTTLSLMDGDIVKPYYPAARAGDLDGVVSSSTSSMEALQKAGNEELSFVVNIEATTKNKRKPHEGEAFVEASKRIKKEGERMSSFTANDGVKTLPTIESMKVIKEDTSNIHNKAMPTSVKSEQAKEESQDTVSVKEEPDKEDTTEDRESTAAKSASIEQSAVVSSTMSLAQVDSQKERESTASKDSATIPFDGVLKNESTDTKNDVAAMCGPTKADKLSPENFMDTNVATCGPTEANKPSSENSMDTNIETKAEPAPSVQNVAAQEESSKAQSSQSETEQSSSEEEFDIEDPRQEIIEILEGVDAPGSFATSGCCEGNLTMPGIEVDGIGLVGLPLSESQAKLLAARCEQAPFGRGSETLVDKSVRNTFQLAPEHFKITNPRWDQEISSLLSTVRHNLGVQSHLKVEAQLYKMLLYEEGSFFTMHRDSEKVDGMFGTLVVVLPTLFTGGELVVKHRRKVKSFAQSASSGFATQYAAFYADCKHELKPVTSGHRICLVYNLVKTGDGAFPRAQRNCHVLSHLKQAVNAWTKSFDGNKLVIMTEHLYTPAGIGSGGGSAKLKGNDAAVVDLLEQAVEEGIEVDWDYGTLSYSESGYGEEDGYYSYFDGGSSFSWGETTDSELSLSLSSWDGVNISFDEIVPEDYWEDKEPEDETFEPTGNEGVNAERQYADESAIVIWPRSKRWVIVTNNDTGKMCKYLLRACTPGSRHSEPTSDCIAKVKEVSEQIISPGSSSCSHYSRSDGTQSHVSTLMKAITQLGNQQTALEFLDKYTKAGKQCSPDFVLQEMSPFLHRFGADAVGPYLVALIDRDRFAADPTKIAQFVLKCNNLLKVNETFANIAADVVVALVDALSPVNSNDRQSPSKSLDSFPLKNVLQLFYGKGAVANGVTLARRIIDYITWGSCLPIKQSPSSSLSTTQITQPKGPTVLGKAGLVEMLESLPHGWDEFSLVLTDAIEKLFSHGSNYDAVSLVEALAPLSCTIDSSNSARAQVCARMTSLVCDKMLTSEPTRWQSNTSARLLLDSYKKLFRIVSLYSPSQAALFTTKAKGLDVDSVLIPFVRDTTARDNGKKPEMRKVLDALTAHCVDVLSSRTSTTLGSVRLWTLPANMPLPRNPQYLSFLKNPCKRVLDWQVRKADHSGFLWELSALTQAGEIRAESYQPGGSGYYHFKITKLKQRTITAESFANMTCNCANSSSQSSYGYRYSDYASSSRTNCILKKYKITAEKRKKDEKILSSLMQLLPQELRSQVATRKRQASTTAVVDSSVAVGSTDLTTTAGQSANATARAYSAAKRQKQAPSCEVIDLT